MELDLLARGSFASGDSASESSTDALSRDEDNQKHETDALYQMLCEVSSLIFQFFLSQDF